MSVIVELLKLGAVGFLSGVFGALLALRRYKHEKWWEMRVDAYRSVIESLSDLVAIYEESNRNWESSPSEPEAISQEIREATAKIRKHRDLGAFLFSNEAVDALTSFADFKVDYYSVTDPSDVYGPFGQKSRQCLERMVVLSRRDLAIKGKWL